MSIDLKEVGAVVKAIRRLRRMTQQELADRAQVSANYISLFENGHRGIGLDGLNALSEALGIPASYLAILAERPEHQDSQIQQLLGQLQETVRCLVAVSADYGFPNPPGSTSDE